MFLLVCRLLELLRLICLIIVLLIKISVKRSYMWTCEFGQGIFLKLLYRVTNKSLNWMTTSTGAAYKISGFAYSSKQGNTRLIFLKCWTVYIKDILVNCTWKHVILQCWSFGVASLLGKTLEDFTLLNLFEVTDQANFNVFRTALLENDVIEMCVI